MSCTDTRLLSSIRKFFWKRSQGKKKKYFFLINEMAKCGLRAEVEQFCWASCFLQSMGLCKASTVRFQLCPPLSPVVVSVGCRSEGEGWEEGCISTLNAVCPVGRACCPWSLSFQLQQSPGKRRHRAGLGTWMAAFSCPLWLSGILLCLCVQNNWRGCHLGTRVLSQQQRFWVFFCLFLKTVLTPKLKAFAAAVEIYSL